MYIIAYKDKEKEEKGIEALFMDIEDAEKYLENETDYQLCNRTTKKEWMIIEIDENRASLMSVLLDEAFVNYLFEKEC